MINFPMRNCWRMQCLFTTGTLDVPLQNPSLSLTILLFLFLESQYFSETNIDPKLKRMNFSEDLHKGVFEGALTKMIPSAINAGLAAKASASCENPSPSRGNF